MAPAEVTRSRLEEAIGWIDAARAEGIGLVTAPGCSVGSITGSGIAGARLWVSRDGIDDPRDGEILPSSDHCRAYALLRGMLVWYVRPRQETWH